MAQGGTMPSRTGRRRPVAPSASSGVGAAGNQEGAEEILEEEGMQQVWESVRCQRCQQQPVSNTRRTKVDIDTVATLRPWCSA